jgi:catechol 2,3-dioxygenase-like lactoylglutathione lyase family enzyme
LTVRPFHHIGYVVPDIEDAAKRFAGTLGAGPFLAIGHVPLADATWRGEPAVYDHSTAFGMWGETLVELSQIHEAAPAGLDAFMGRAGAPHVGHAAWLVDDLDDETIRLERLGLELMHTGSAGPVRAHWFDGGTLFGHPIEVLRRCPENLSLYAAVREAATGWDGVGALRPAFASDAA